MNRIICEAKIRKTRQNITPLSSMPLTTFKQATTKQTDSGSKSAHKLQHRYRADGKIMKTQQWRHQTVGWREASQRGRCALAHLTRYTKLPWNTKSAKRKIAKSKYRKCKQSTWSSSICAQNSYLIGWIRSGSCCVSVLFSKTTLWPVQCMRRRWRVGGRASHIKCQLFCCSN